MVLCATGPTANLRNAHLYPFSLPAPAKAGFNLAEDEALLKAERIVQDASA